MLNTYLTGFFRRTQPLMDVEGAIAAKLASFDSQWAAGAVRGWEHTASDDSQRPLYCAACTRPSQQPSRRGLGACGPALTRMVQVRKAHDAHATPSSAGAKDFAKQTVFDAHLTGKKHVKV